VPSADRVLAIPGPSVLFAVGRTLAGGRRVALLSVAPNAVGEYIQVIAVAFGIGTLAEQSVAAFTALKLVGGAYLVYLGMRAWWNLPTRSAYARIDRMHALLKAHIADTRADPDLDDRTHVLALLIRARGEDGEALTDLDLRDELMTLVIAGHETTATAMAWACDVIAHNADATPRMREDSDYLKAAAKEVLRARTLAYASAARHPLEPFPIGEWVIGPDALILVDAQGVHGDPEVYPDPDQFRPERFLDDPPDGYACIPFGGGAHRCLGASLAMLELETFLQTLVEHVQLAPVGRPARPKRRGPILAPDTGGRVRVGRLSRSLAAAAA